MTIIARTLAIAAAGASLVSAVPANAITTTATPAIRQVEAAHQARGYESDRYGSWGRQDYRRGYRSSYDERLRRDSRVWRGNDGRYYCRKQDGTAGLIIGGVAGALVGRSLDGGYDRSLGTILGAAGGALLGREIDRGGSSCR